MVVSFLCFFSNQLFLLILANCYTLHSHTKFAYSVIPDARQHSYRLWGNMKGIQSAIYAHNYAVDNIIIVCKCTQVY